MHDIGLGRIAVAHIGNVADIDHRAIHALDRQVAQRVDRRRGIVELDRGFEAPDLLRSDRRNQILRRERIGDVLAGKTTRLHRGGIEVNLHLTRLAAVRKRYRCAGNGDQRRTHDIEAEVGERLFGQALTRQGELDDRYGRGVVVQDQRRRGAGRHLFQQRLRDRRDLGVRDANVHVRLEEHFGDADGVVRIGLDMFNVIDRRRQGALKLGRHTAGHLIRRQPGILPDHSDYRAPDIRKDVDGCAQGSEGADDQNDQGEHDKRVGTLKCYADKGNHAADVFWSRGTLSAVATELIAPAYGDASLRRTAQNLSDFFSMTNHNGV